MAKKQDRDAIDQEFIWGRQPVLDLLRHSPEKCLKLWISERAQSAFVNEFVTLAKSASVIFQKVPPSVLDEMCPKELHQGVIARITAVEQIDLDIFLKSPYAQAKHILIVVLDHILDPHNIGAIVRTAEAAGAAAVIYPRRRSALPGSTVVKVSAGAALRVPMIAVTNIAQTLLRLQEEGFWIVGLDHNAEQSFWEASYPKRTILVIGAEGEGLSRLVKERCDLLFRIPMTGETGSLNASVAAALGMFEWARAWGEQEQ